MCSSCLVYRVTVFHHEDGTVDFEVEGIAGDSASLSCASQVLHDVADTMCLPNEVHTVT